MFNLAWQSNIFSLNSHKMPAFTHLHVSSSSKIFPGPFTLIDRLSTGILGNGISARMV